MFNKQAFYDEFAKYHGIDFKVTSLEEDCYYQEGCPTCGGTYEYSIVALGENADGKIVYKTVNGNLTDFLNSLE